jgi:hypothetical protein
MKNNTNGLRAHASTWIAAIVVGFTAMLLAILPFSAHAAAGPVTFNADTDFDLGNGVTLEVKNGSTADSVTVNNSNELVVAIDSGDSITVASPDRYFLYNDGGYEPCLGDSNETRLTLNGPGTGTETVTFSPVTSDVCPQSGGGSPTPSGSVSTTTTECSVTNPNGGETLEGGTSTDIVWDSQGTGIDNLNIHYSNDNGSSWTLITSGTDNDGLYSWSVPTSLNGSDALIKIECREAGGGVLDTDQSDATFSVAAAGQTDQDQGTGGTVSLPSGVSIGDLLKLPNDGDPSTYSDTAVYYIGLDGKRHPFPHAKVYKTWYADFSGVEVVSSDTMAAIQLGDPVLSRPGTHWVKIQSVAKTYYVEPGSYKLRHIADEQTAERLGGSDWNQNVIDMPVTFFNNFDMGDPIEFSDLDNGWPEASLLKTPTDSAIWYTQNGERRQVEDMAAFNANGFQQRFIEENTQTGWQSLPTGNPIEGAEDGLFHEQLTP